MNTGTDIINEYFNRTRRDYARIWHTDKHMGFHKPGVRSHDQAVVQMIQEMATRAKIRPDELVVDCGCGIGGSSIWLTENIGCHVLGVDINPNSIRIARQAAYHRGLDPIINFINTDYVNIPLPNATADVVWFCESLCYARDKKLVLSEAARVLKPEGRIIVADGFKVCDGPELGEWTRAWELPELAEVGRFREWLEAVGFGQIQWEDIRENVKPSAKRLFWLTLLYYPLRKMKQRLGLSTDTEVISLRGFFNLCMSAIKHQCAYGMFTAQKA